MTTKTTIISITILLLILPIINAGPITESSIINNKFESLGFNNIADYFQSEAYHQAQMGMTKAGLKHSIREENYFWNNLFDQESITKKIINNTVIIDPLEIEKYPEIKNFLNNLEDCNWCVACGSYAHYTRIEAEKQNISIHEITLTTKIMRFGVSDGHRINFFYADDGHKVYIDNVANGRYILELDELISYLKDRFGLDVERIGFKNIKLSKI